MVFRNVQNVPKNVEKYFARKERYLTFYQVGNSFGVGIQIARFLIQLRYSTQNCSRVGWRSNEKAYKATDKMIMTYTLLQIIPLLDFYFTVKSIQIKWIDSSFYIFCHCQTNSQHLPIYANSSWDGQDTMFSICMGYSHPDSGRSLYAI